MTKVPPPPLLFRIIGNSGDGLVVTLGKYRTREEAEIDFARFKNDPYYRNVKLSEIPQPPAAPAGAPAPAK